MPKLFNVAVDSVVCHFMSLAVEYKPSTHGGLGMVEGWCTDVFDTDDRMIGSREPE